MKSQQKLQGKIKMDWMWKRPLALLEQSAVMRINHRVLSHKVAAFSML